MDYKVDWIIIKKTDGTSVDYTEKPYTKPLPNTASILSSEISEILISDDKIKITITSKPKIVKKGINRSSFKEYTSYQIFPKSIIEYIKIPVVTSLTGDKVKWIEFSNGSKFQPNYGEVKGIIMNDHEIVVSLSGTQYTPTTKKNLIPYMEVYFISQNPDFTYHL